MPIKSEKLKIKLPKGKDRRVKITEAMKLDIVDKMKHWWTQLATAEFHWISRTAVRFIMDPEALRRAKEAHRERRKDWRYYDREKHRISVRWTRSHRKENISIQSINPSTMKHLFEATVWDLKLTVDHKYEYEWELFLLKWTRIEKATFEPDEILEEDLSICHSVDLFSKQDVIEDFTNECIYEGCEQPFKDLLKLLEENNNW